MRRKCRRGVSFVEVLVAVIILSIVAGGAVATWNFSEKVPVNKRVTEMASLIAVHEIEAIKAKKYLNVQDGTTTTYYDKYGISTSGSNAVYKATTTVGAPTGFTSTNTTADLREIVCTVQNSGATKTYETQRTLLTFGGF